MEYLPLIILACILNWRQKQALFLVVIIGLGLVIPVPKEYGAFVWYSVCGVIDFTIMCLALSLKVRLSLPIAALSLLFIVVHFLGWTFDGYPPESPYHNFARTIEFTELVVCITLSNPIIQYIEGKLYES